MNPTDQASKYFQEQENNITGGALSCFHVKNLFDIETELKSSRNRGYLANFSCPFLLARMLKNTDTKRVQARLCSILVNPGLHKKFLKKHTVYTFC